MKIYVAGKITGLDGYKAKFEKASKMLEVEGHNVMNPAILPPGFLHHEYMKICYAMITVCEGVYFLDNWQDSIGAKMEYDYAKAINKQIMFQGSDLKDLD